MKSENFSQYEQNSAHNVGNKSKRRRLMSRKSHPFILDRDILMVFHICRMPPNEMAEYPNWLTIYLLQVILPMVGVVVIALKILLKNGKDLKREFL